MQCDNCERSAIYVYAPRMISPAHYCEKHLPSFLRNQIRTGLVQTTEAYNDVRQEVLAKLATKSDPQPQVDVADEPSAEESPVEESPVEEKPKRRRRPRKTAEAPEETTEA